MHLGCACFYLAKRLEPRSRPRSFMLTRAQTVSLPTQSGTVAAAAAIASVTPHGTGAIDVVMVRSPLDGVTRSSPFYVRFGKYTGARSADRRVAIEVNGKVAGFCMHLGRTGEAWFLAQGEWREERGKWGTALLPSPLTHATTRTTLHRRTRLGRPRRPRWRRLSVGLLVR